jgi:hypothetical protein
MKSTTNLGNSQLFLSWNVIDLDVLFSIISFDLFLSCCLSLRIFSIFPGFAESWEILFFFVLPFLFLSSFPYARAHISVSFLSVLFVSFREEFLHRQFYMQEWNSGGGASPWQTPQWGEDRWVWLWEVIRNAQQNTFELAVSAFAVPKTVHHSDNCFRDTTGLLWLL